MWNCAADKPAVQGASGSRQGRDRLEPAEPVVSIMSPVGTVWMGLPTSSAVVEYQPGEGFTSWQTVPTVASMQFYLCQAFMQIRHFI